jgi:hypothetical protein
MKAKAQSRGPATAGKLRTKDRWKQLIANYKPPGRKARPKQKTTRKKANTTMPKKTKAEQAELSETPEQQEEYLPPPDPPVVPSLPTEPPAPDAVDASEKGAQPEDNTAVRELVLAPEWERPVEPPPP